MIGCEVDVKKVDIEFNECSEDGLLKELNDWEEKGKT
jgi:hypothetical protein